VGAGGRVGPLRDFDQQEPFLGFPVHSQVATLLQLQALLSSLVGVRIVTVAYTGFKER
jgi:hypothetical protein